MSLLTFPAVEAALLKRVELKAATFGQDIDPATRSKASTIAAPTAASRDGPCDPSHPELECVEPSFKVSPAVVAGLYGKWIMPLTKQVQVQYLLRRLD